MGGRWLFEMTDTLLVTESGGFNLPLSQTLCCLWSVCPGACLSLQAQLLSCEAIPVGISPSSRSRVTDRYPMGWVSPHAGSLVWPRLKFHISHHVKILQLYIYFFFNSDFQPFWKSEILGIGGPVSIHGWSVRPLVTVGELVAAAHSGGCCSWPTYVPLHMPPGPGLFPSSRATL